MTQGSADQAQCAGRRTIGDRLAAPVMLRSWWETWSYWQAGGLIGIFVCLCLVPLDLALLGIDLTRLPMLVWLRLVSGKLVLPLLGVTIIGNAILVDRLLNHRLPLSLKATIGQRIIRILRSCPPLIGLWELARWREIARKDANGQVVAPLGQLKPGGHSDIGILAAAGRGIDAILRFFEASMLWYVWFAGLNALALGLGCCWLGSQVLHHPGWLLPAIAVSLLLHMAACLVIRHHAVWWARVHCQTTLQQRLSRIAVLGLLLPAPLCTVVVLSCITRIEPGWARSIAGAALQQRSLGTSLGQRQSPDVLAARLAGTDRLERERSSLLRNAPLPRDMCNLQALLRTKLLCLFPEAMVVGWLLVELARRSSVAARWLEAGFFPFLLGVLTVATASLLAACIRITIQQSGRPAPRFLRQSWTGPLALSAAVFGGGCWLGIELGLVSASQCGTVLFHTGGFGTICLFYRFLLQGIAPAQLLTRLSRADAALWGVVLMAAGCLGLSMMAGPTVALSSVQRLSAAMWIGPVLGLLAGLGHAGSMRRSVTAGDPPAGPWTLRMLTATMVLPLGTLACPWWVALRDQLSQRRKATLRSAMSDTSARSDCCGAAKRSG